MYLAQIITDQKKIIENPQVDEFRRLDDILGGDLAAEG
jgi:hypothetical protein